MRTLALSLMLGAATLSAAPITPTPVTATAQSPAPALLRASDDFSRIAEEADAWVVNISTTQYIHQRIGSFWEQFYGIPLGGAERTFERQSLGSGFILTPDGEILTNAHVIAGADEITVSFKDGSQSKAQVLGQDPNVDLALLKIKVNHPLTPAPLGDSDKVKVGQWAIAIGNPFGFDHTLTVGVISAKERTNIFRGQGAAKYQNYLQTDASINHGNSGGPLCDINGDVIGMNTAISTPNDGSIGIGFAIPINFIKRAIPDLRRAGKVVAPKLGFFTQDLDQRLAQALKLTRPDGVLVTDVAAGGAADKGGLKRGDVILKLNGKETNTSGDLRTRIYGADPDKPMSLDVWRNGQALTLVFSSQILKASERQRSTWHGLTVKGNSPQVARQDGLALSQGVVVTKVEPNSSADGIGIQPGDVLLEVNQTPIPDQAAWDALTSQLDEGQDAVIRIVRGSQSAYVVLPAEQ